MVGIAIIGIVIAMVVSYMGEPRANTKSFASTMVAEIDAARTRAISTRRWNRIGFDTTESKVIVEQSTTTGMGTPEDDEWERVSSLTVPKAITLYAATTTCDYVDGNEPSEGDGLDEYIVLKPDGTGTAFTLYLQSFDDHEARVYVYRATGTAYAKESW
jgi:hypothetical protein